MTVAARPAATVALVRDGAGGIEVLMMVRPMAAAFAPRAFVFPGGRIDESDGDPGWSDLLDLDDSGRALVAEDGEDEGSPAALAFRVGAIREMFEESAMLIGSSQPPDTRWAEGARAQVHGGTQSFASLVRAAGLRLRPAELVYFARWITPESEPRRYDTRFYAAAIPDGQTPSAAAGEVESLAWITPAEALQNAESAEAYVMPPTRAALERLMLYRDVKSALAGLYATRDLRPVLPRLLNRQGDPGPGIRVVLPGDPGYDEAGAL